MDFNTRSNVEHTKTLYGEKSSQYNWSKILSNAKELIKKNNSLTLEKQCKMETIRLTFEYDSTSDKVFNKTKKHYSLDEIFKKEQKTQINIHLIHFIDYELFDLLTNGYIIID